MYYTLTMQFNEEFNHFEDELAQDIEDGEEFEDELEEPLQGEKKNYIYVLQVGLCCLFLIGLVILKLNDKPKYDEITAFYKDEISREIELPNLLGRDDAGSSMAGESALSSLSPDTKSI